MSKHHGHIRNENPPQGGETATLLARLERRVAEGPDEPALRFISARGGRPDKVDVLTRGQLFGRARAVASRLLGLVSEPGARCAILCETRVEWVVADIACAMAGLISVPFFPNVDPATLSRTLEATDCRLAVAENPWQARKLLDVEGRRNGPGKAPALILIDPEMTLVSGARASLDEFGMTPARFVSFLALEEMPTRSLLDGLKARMADADPEACITLCPTPGTEGQVKVVTWTDANMVAAANALGGALDKLLSTPKSPRQGREDSVLLALPLAQALGRTTLWAALLWGITVALPRSDATVFEDLPTLGPTAIIGVPSLFERARREVMAHLRSRGVLVGLASRWSHEPRGEGLLGLLKARVSEGLVRPILRARFGPRMRVLISGGAPLREGLQSFYLRHGISLRQAYGLAETTGPTHLDTAAEPSVGAIGSPLAGTEIRIGIDGELLVRGPSVTPGYWRDPDVSRRAFEDGWFATGDLAKENAGQFAITGRKRDLIVLDNGRVLAPRPIERELLEEPLIAQALVLGDKRDFPVALISLQRDELLSFARAQGLPVDDAPASLSALTRHPKVHAHVEQLIARVNQGLPTQAQLRKFAILPEPFSVSAGELTEAEIPRRGLIAERYRTLIDSFYAESF